MRYKNIKTGAVIDSSFKITGDNWEEVNPQELTEKVEEVKEVNNDGKATEEYIEEEVNLAEMTNRELEKLAKDEKITLTSEDKKNKETRIAAIVKAFEE